MDRKIGVIAGSGFFPLLVIEEAQRQGLKCVVVGIKKQADESLKEKVDEFEWVEVGEIAKILSFFKKHRVRKALLAGKVEHRKIFQDVTLDTYSSRLLTQLVEKGPVSIIKKFIDLMTREGVQIIEPTSFLSSFFCDEGILTDSPPLPEREEDIQFGLRIARRIADLDIGQTVIVKDKIVVAVEGMEGTDEAIRRGGSLAGGGVIVAKAGRTSQDMRIDLPAVGLSTVQALIEAGGEALCIEAHKVVFFQKEQAVSLANLNNILILAKNITNM